MTGRQLCDLRNNPRVCGHTPEHFEEMASCIKASEKHNALCGAVYMCGRGSVQSSGYGNFRRGEGCCAMILSTLCMWLLR